MYRDTCFYGSGRFVGYDYQYLKIVIKCICICVKKVYMLTSMCLNQSVCLPAREAAHVPWQFKHSLMYPLSGYVYVLNFLFPLCCFGRAEHSCCVRFYCVYLILIKYVKRFSTVLSLNKTV